MKKTILVLLIMFVSCYKGGKLPPDTSLSIFFKNSTGSYLLSNGINGFKEDSIRVLKIINGNAIPLDSGYAYTFYNNPPSGKRFLYLAFMNWTTTNNATNTILIRFKYNVIDTLKYYGHVTIPGQYDSVYYNGVLQTSNPFDIIK